MFTIDLFGLIRHTLVTWSEMGKQTRSSIERHFILPVCIFVDEESRRRRKRGHYQRNELNWTRKGKNLRKRKQKQLQKGKDFLKQWTNSE